jgi:hypothetical protein
LFLPSFWSMTDHHFAERHPNHIHIYLGTPSVDHIHPYQVPHSHEAGHKREKAAADGLPSRSGASGHIVYLTPPNEVIQSLVSLIVTVLPADVSFPDLEDNWSLLGAASNVPFPPEAFIAPPEKPPPL